MPSTGALYDALALALREHRLVTQVTVIDGPDAVLGKKLLIGADGSVEGTLDHEVLRQAILASARSRDLETGTAEIELGDERFELFLEVFAPPAQLVIVGAVHVAIELVHIARRLGFRCVVVDPRSVFATPERFAHADELIVRWPADALADLALHANTYCVFLTHDPKLDDPAIGIALERGVRYVGALGSRRTHGRRIAALRAMGLKEEAIDRIHAPIGVPLGGRRPEEVALSIAAELVQARHGVARRQGHEPAAEIS
jgi:xanthine dehydrogenase accessory factor